VCYTEVSTDPRLGKGHQGWMVDKSVLIVDDEEKVVFFLRESLEELGRDFTIGTARSAEEALQKIETHPYDLVISDLRMPGIDGLELLEQIREKHPQTRFVLMTAYGSDEVEARAQSLDVFDYITKPFHVSDLLDVARHALTDTPETGRGLSLPDDRMEASNKALSNLRFEVGAQCVVLADIRGQILCEVGLTQGLETGTFIPLVADGLTTVSRMAQYLRDEKTFNLTFYEGKEYDIYYAGVGKDLVLTLIFDRRKQPSRIGMVLLYVKRTTQEILKAAYGVAENEDSLPEYHEGNADPGAEAASPEIAPERGQVKPSSDESQKVVPAGSGKGSADSTFGIEEALRKGLIDEDFAQLLKGES
jgi:CheY-like chemotaxis protein